MAPHQRRLPLHHHGVPVLVEQDLLRSRGHILDRIGEVVRLRAIHLIEPVLAGLAPRSGGSRRHHVPVRRPSAPHAASFHGPQEQLGTGGPVQQQTEDLAARSAVLSRAAAVAVDGVPRSPSFQQILHGRKLLARSCQHQERFAARRLLVGNADHIGKRSEDPLERVQAALLRGTHCGLLHLHARVPLNVADRRKSARLGGTRAQSKGVVRMGSHDLIRTGQQGGRILRGAQHDHDARTAAQRQRLAKEHDLLMLPPECRAGAQPPRGIST
eukprot:scaffold1421_cov255-Pinguiococcus_pyrenoidosus.AAC.12